MIGLVRMRVTAYLRTQAVLAPWLATLAILGILYGGGQAEPAEAYGVSAVALFPIFAWQVKILLDIEPDVQRQIAATAVGSRSKEIASGLIAGVLAALVTLVVGVVVPWAIGGVALDPGKVPLDRAIASGVWVHLLALLGGLALGALASRAVSRSVGTGALVIVAGTVGTIVVGLKDSPVPWLAPPLMPGAREVVGGATLGDVALLSAWGVVWAAVALAGYFWLRRDRP